MVSPKLYYYLEGYSGQRAGGSEKQQYILAKELVNRGHNVTIIIEESAPVIQNDDFNIVRACPSGLSGLSEISKAKILPALRLSDSDLYYVRGFPLYLVLCFITSKFNNGKIIYSISNDWQVNEKYINKMNVLLRKCYIMSMKKSEVVVQKQKQGEELKNNFGINSTIVPNIVEIPKKEIVLPQNKREHILWVGRISKTQKNPDEFLSLAEKVPTEKFVMIGAPEPGEEDYYEQISNKASDIENLSFEGFVSPDQIGEYYNKSKILVNTSEFEGFPNTFLEAWGYYVPIISQSVSFDLSNMDNERRDIVMNPDDSSSFPDLVKKVAEQENLREKIGQSARKYVENNHSSSASYKRFIQVLESADMN